MPQASSIRAEVTGQWRSSSVAWYNDARIRANSSWSLTGESSFSQARMNSTCDASLMSWSGRVRAPECGFSAANCREGANSRQCIASTPAPPSHYPNRENSEGNNTGSGRDPGRPEKATARPVARRSHAHPSALARADSRGENLLALLA